MSNCLQIVRKQLLEPGSIDNGHIESVLGDMMSQHMDAADLYFQSSRHEGWVLEDSIVKNASYNADRGVGVRSISGEKTGFAYANDIELDALRAAANASKSIAKSGQSASINAWNKSEPRTLYGYDNPMDSLEQKEKVELLKNVDDFARKLDDRIKRVTVSLSGVHENILVACSDGTLAGDVRPLVRLNVSVIAEEQGRIESGSFGGGGRCSYQMFFDDELWKTYADKAVKQALLNLTSVAVPAGLMPVVLGSGWNGVLLHEAVGHGLEGDFNRKGSSAFSGRVGEQVASKGCTVIDDGTLEGRRGSLNVDDEGVPTNCTVLIENGILKGYMQDKMNARLMSETSTGNGRRESYSCLPMPRMTNTYMLSGDYEHDEIIASVDKGIYVANMGGGQVDITSGKFVFSTSEAYLIEKGKVSVPVKGATLIGNGPEVMTKISMIGNNMALDSGVGICGKEGQSVPVGVGQPTLKIDEITVGGTG